MTQSVKHPAKVRRVGSLVLIADIALALFFIFFGPSLFGLTPMLSLMIAVMLALGGIISFIYFRAVARRDDMTGL